jgi:hypothetical protein
MRNFKIVIPSRIYMVVGANGDSPFKKGQPRGAAPTLVDRGRLLSIEDD